MTNYIKSTSQFHQFNQIEQNPQFGLITIHRIFNSSKTTKLIKLNHKDHDYNILEQKSNDQFHKIRFVSSKTPKYAKSENNPSMHGKNACKTENK